MDVERFFCYIGLFHEVEEKCSNVRGCVFCKKKKKLFERKVKKVCIGRASPLATDKIIK